MNCQTCGRPLTTDEAGLNYKLIARDTKVFLCKTHLAEYFKVSESVLDQKIAQFKRQGCLLFSEGEPSESGLPEMVHSET